MSRDLLKCILIDKSIRNIYFQSLSRVGVKLSFIFGHERTKYLTGSFYLIHFLLIFAFA